MDSRPPLRIPPKMCRRPDKLAGQHRELETLWEDWTFFGPILLSSIAELRLSLDSRRWAGPLALFKLSRMPILASER